MFHKITPMLQAVAVSGVLLTSAAAHAQSENHESLKIGLGIEGALYPMFAVGGIGPAMVSLRLWMDRLMIEPLFGFSIITSSTNTNNNTLFGLGAGALVGYALSTGNLRPIVGGGLTFAVTSAGNTQGAITFGPMLGLEYHFSELPALAFDASLYLPFGMAFNPFAFSLATAGSALIGFHYYF